MLAPSILWATRIVAPQEVLLTKINGPTGDAVPAAIPQEAYSADYWRCHAARVRSLASRHDGKLQDRLANIASSYDLLAERAQRVGEQINEIEAIDND